MDAMRTLNEANARQRWRFLMWQRKCQQHADKLELHHHSCPVCGGEIDRRVVEHPLRQAGVDGQTILLCKRCGSQKVFDGTVDEARALHEGGYRARPGRMVVSLSLDGKDVKVGRG